MHPDNAPRSLASLPGWRLPVFSLSHLAAMLLGLLVVAYVAGWMVGQEQERDLQRARQLACQADQHCLRP
ncbi:MULTISPECIES: hypothetical protein [unclassified Uliginosibacterium]|uniref:hypothetical protein n=1 Tax=unclassified Uliginosibacterium TaxID=2621521 RepID=UPI00117F7891|nr:MULTISPECIES: hypothetical protein [unclassified Uliginosibacterium]MDO6386459.1 hypothetical protein [Uliginosibacterium sp. 31-12]